MKKSLLLFALLFTVFSLTAQTHKYSRIQIPRGVEQAMHLSTLGINLDNAYSSPEGDLIFEAASFELQRLKEKGIVYDVLIEDMTHYYVERNKKPESLIDLHTGSLLSQSYPVPDGFELGSMGGYSTYDEFLGHLDNMYLNYPSLITSKQPISNTNSIEDRPIYYVKIASSNQPGPKPKILYTGMLHAREPGGMQHLLYFMYYLLENYPDNPEIQYIVDHAELYFVPVVNPDGYIHNQQIAPNGGGMWRKNRRANSDGTYGVDLNRNFGYQWGYDNIGSSPNPGDETYRGTHGFSEPETQVIKELCEDISFTKALNYHSYSNLLLYPWGYTSNITVDNSIFFNHARRMTSDNGYTYGPSSTTIYNNNGGSDDWMYGEQTSKPKIFAYTPEIGSSSDGFWPPVNRIIPHCQENMYQSMMTALLSMKYAEVNITGPKVVSTHANYLPFNIKRFGFQDGGEFTVSIQALSEEIISTGDPIVFSNMNFFETRYDSVYYELDPNISGGTICNFLLEINNGHYTRTDTISKVFGLEETVFFDDCSNLNNWTGNWGLSSVHFVSPPSSITDSPSGNYPLFGNRTITTVNPISLNAAAAAFLNFKARWDINGNGAYVQVRISTNQGSTWIPLQGKHTRPGLFSAVQGQPVYSDKQLSWVDESIDLSEYAGSQIMLRFYLSSSSWNAGTADGYYFDDIEVVKVTYNTPVYPEFSADETLILEGDNVQFNDMTAGNPISWQWYFPGGEPSSSTVQNPVVTYPGSGDFDVELIVGNGPVSDTLLKTAYVVVLDSIMCRPDIYAGADTVILPWENYYAATATAGNYSELLWTSSGDGVFDNPAILNPVYTPGETDILNQQVYLMLTAQPVYDICSSTIDTLDISIVDYTGTNDQPENIISVYPNPASGFINIEVSNSFIFGDLEIINLKGEKVIEKTLNKHSSGYIDLTGLPQGIYLLRFISGSGTFIKKIAVIKENAR